MAYENKPLLVVDYFDHTRGRYIHTEFSYEDDIIEMN